MNDQKALVPSPAEAGQVVTLYRYAEDEEEQQQEQLLDLAEIKAMVWRQRYWIISSVIVALVLGAVATMLATRIYQSTASVQIEENTPLLTKGQEVLDPTIMSGASMQRYLQAQVDVLKSRYIATRVVDQLKLHQNPVFLKAMELDQTQLPTDALRQIAIGTLQGGLDVTLPGGSQIAFINFRSPDPQLSAAVANGYAENLITGNLERKYETSAYARDFLQKELERAKQRLEASERAALAYARNAQIINASSAPTTAEGGQGASAIPAGSLTVANLAHMNSQLASARTARIQAEERWRTASSMPLLSLPEVVENGAIQSLQSDRAAQVAALQRLEQTYTPDYPDVVRTRASIASIDAEIQSRARQVLDSIRQRYVTAARQENAIASRMGGLKSATLEEQDRRVQLDILSREAAGNRSLYDGLLQRYREVSTAAGVTNNNISILDRALPNPNPISPKPLKNMLLALFAGLGLGFGIAFLRDRMIDAIRSPDDVAPKLGLPLLGTTPNVASLDIRTELTRSRSALAEAYHSVRSGIEFATQHGAPRTLLITSAQPGEGKSTTAIAMAADFTTVGLKVLLVDADLRRPSLHRSMQVANENGLVHVISGQMPLHEAVQIIGGIHFVPSGAIPPNPTELLGAHNIRNFLRHASAEYDLVIFDGPPVMGLADSPQISSVVEGTVVVLQAETPRQQARTVLKRLKAAKANLLGVVLTKYNAKSAGYGNNYGYYYQYGEEQDEKVAARSPKHISAD